MSDVTESIEENQVVEQNEENLLVPKNEYLSAGAHIGMKQHAADMKKFIFKIRPDGLAVLDLQKLDERIRVAANLMAKANIPLLVSRKGVGAKGVEKYSELVNGRANTGRFYPGMLTNPKYEKFFEPDLMFVIDPLVDNQAIVEAVHQKIPVVALCDTFNETKNIDLIIPVNNKGKRSVALVMWILTREVLKIRGKIKTDKEFKPKVEDFEGTEAYGDRREE